VSMPNKTLHRRQVQKPRATDYEDSELVFAIGKGTPLDAQNLVNRHFKPLLEAREAARHTLARPPSLLLQPASQ
jgi:hypothetical protein